MVCFIVPFSWNLVLVKGKLWSQETFDELSFVEAFSKHFQVPDISTCAVWMHLCPVHTHLQDTVLTHFSLPSSSQAVCSVVLVYI